MDAVQSILSSNFGHHANKSLVTDTWDFVGCIKSTELATQVAELAMLGCAATEEEIALQ